MAYGNADHDRCARIIEGAIAELQELRREIFALERRLADAGAAGDPVATLATVRRDAAYELAAAMESRDGQILALTKTLQEKNAYIRRLVSIRSAIMSFTRRSKKD